MNHKKVSRNIKPAALWALRQNGSKNFIVVAPILELLQIFRKDVGLERIVKRGRRTKTGFSKLS